MFGTDIIINISKWSVLNYFSPLIMMCCKWRLLDTVGRLLTSCKYVQPMLYNQLIQVSAKIQEYENRLKIIYRISDAKTDEKLATGHTTQVAVDMKNNEMCFVSPKFLLKKVEECELFL